MVNGAVLSGCHTGGGECIFDSHLVWTYMSSFRRLSKYSILDWTRAKPLRDGVGLKWSGGLKERADNCVAEDEKKVK